MIGRDFAASFQAVQALKPQSVSGAVVGGSIDCSNADEVDVVLDVGTITATGTLDCKVQESAAADTGQADISGAAFTQCTPSNDETVYVGRIKMNGRKRYLNVVVTQATAAALAGVMFILYKKGMPAQTVQWTV